LKTENILIRQPITTPFKKMLSLFPSINPTSQIPIKNISIGEYYYIQSGDDLFHGKVTHATNQCIEFADHRKAGSTLRDNASYLTGPSTISTFCWANENPEALVDEVNICVAINPAKTMLATGMSNNQVILWDLKTITIVQMLGENENEWVLCVKFNALGTMIAASSTSSTVRIWSTTAPYTLLYLIQHNGAYINELSFAPDNSVLIFNGGGSSDANQFRIVFWSLETNACINYIPILQETLMPNNMDNDDLVGDNNIYVNAFEVCGANFLIASINIAIGLSVVALWSTNDGQTSSQMVCLKRFHSAFTKLMYDSNSESVFACGTEGDIYVLEIPALNVLYKISLEGDPDTRINTAALNIAHDKLIARTRGGGTYIYNLTQRAFEWYYPVLEPEKYNEELDLSIMVEFGLGESHFISCSAYEITRAPFRQTCTLIADEFRVECVAVYISASNGLPDAVKWLIREFLSGVVVQV
jgi:WD40 repeat protein